MAAVTRSSRGFHDELAGRLERIAPARSRRRSEFVRAAIFKALREAEEQATIEAYTRHPVNPDTAFDEEPSKERANQLEEKALDQDLFDHVLAAVEAEFPPILEAAR